MAPPCSWASAASTTTASTTAKAGTFVPARREGSFSGSLQIQVGRQTSIMVSTPIEPVRLSNSEPMNP
jgi:hypothetical protein